MAAGLLADVKEGGGGEDLVAFGKQRREENLAAGAAGDRTVLLWDRLARLSRLLHGPVLDEPFRVGGDRAIPQQEATGPVLSTYPA